MDMAILRQKLDAIGWMIEVESMSDQELIYAEEMVKYVSISLTIRQQFALFSAIAFNNTSAKIAIIKSIKDPNISEVEKMNIARFYMSEFPQYSFT